MGVPSRLGLCSAFSIDEKGYIGLGYESETDKDLKEILEYNPTNNTWTQKTNFGVCTSRCCQFYAVEGKGYIGTGYDYDTDVMILKIFLGIQTLYPIHKLKVSRI